MKNSVRMTLLAAAAVSLAACGGGAKLGGGKEGAAQALYQTSKSSEKKGASRLKDLASGAVAEVSVDCTHGGSATFKADTDNTFSNNSKVSISFKVDYNSCNEDGKNEIDGEMAMGFLIDISGDGSDITADMNLALKGDIDISGEISDSLKTDIVETVKIDSNAVNITMKLNGYIETSTEKYTYSNETITFKDGLLPTDESDDNA
ncbi:hypothetical protein P2318_25925 [Myxococcaceae bacterium GXIMD 01537]